MFKGADSEQFPAKRQKKLLPILKGNKKKKEALCKDNPQLFEYFIQVWSVCENYMVKGLPMQYVFFCLCVVTSRSATIPSVRKGENPRSE